MSDKYAKDELESMSDLDLSLMVVESQRKPRESEYSEMALLGIEKAVNKGRVNFCNDWDFCGELVDDLECANLEIKDGYVSCGNKYDSPCSFIKDSGSLKRSVVVVYILAKQQNIIT